MAEVQRIPLGRPPASTWLPTVMAAFALIVVLAVLKPWGQPSPVGGDETPQPTFIFAVPTQEPNAGRGYDPRLFGLREPDPAWELWPAGYVVQFGMAGPLRVTGQEGDPPPLVSPDPTGGPASPSASGSPPSADPSASPGNHPDDQHVVDLGPSDHLVALGINTPREHRVIDVELFALSAGRASRAVPIVRLPTLWESTHFIVIAPEDPAARGQAGTWQPGLYQLDLTTIAGEIREVMLRVRPAQG